MSVETEEALVKDMARKAVSQAGFGSCDTAEAEQAAKERARQLALEVLNF